MTQTGWLPPLDHIHTGCGNCPPRPTTMPLGDVSLHPGFGAWELQRDGETVLYDVHGDRSETAFTTQDCEDHAKAAPEHDWQVRVDGPMAGVIYQRQGEGNWVAVVRLDGFA